MFKSLHFTCMLCLFSFSLLSQTPCDSPNCSPVPMTDVCSDGTNTVTLTCDGGLTGIIWYNSSGAQVGTGCDLIVDNSLIGTGLVGQSECFYYEADDSNSCPGGSCCPVNVTVLNCMTCSIVGTDPTCNGLNNGSATVTPANGVAPFTYAWNNTQTTSTATNLGAGTYTVTITDAAGGTTTCSVMLSAPPALTCSVAATNANCAGGSDGSLLVTATGGTGTYTYLWSNTITTASNPNLSAGNYSVTITDANGCIAVCSGDVADSPPITCSIAGTNPDCAGESTGALDLTATGGTGTLTFDWDNDGAEDPDNDTEDLANMAAGTYTVTVTDANGCTSSCLATLADPPALTCSITGTDLTDCGVNDGTVTVAANGGNPGYTYSLNGGTPQAANTFTGLSAGTYTVTTEDISGCTIECTIMISAPSSPMCTITSSTNVSCVTGSDGSLTATGTGGTGTYEYSIDGTNFQTSGTFSSLSAGNYTITVRNQGQATCTSVCNVTITEPAQIECMMASMDVSCDGGTDGFATVTASGGTAGYTYLWSTGATTAGLVDLGVGLYTVTITDANGCIASCSVTLASPPALTCTLTPVDLACNGDNSGSIGLAPSGGVGPYTFLWSSAQTTQNISGLAAGTYSVTTTDLNGCIVVCSTTLTEPPVLSCTASATDQTDCGINDGTITASATGGTAGYTYSLNGGTAQGTGSFTGLMAGSYTILVTDINGCTSECTATINTPAAPMCSINTSSDVSCFGGTDGSLTATATGGSGTYEFSLDGAAFQTSGSYTGLTAGSYTVTVRNAGDPMCTSVCNVTITEPAVLECTVAGMDVSCAGATDGSATATATGGTAPFVYAWDNGGTTATISNLIEGIYLVTITDANNCVTTCGVTLIAPSTFSCAITASDVLCNGEATGNLDLVVTSGVAPYTYDWSNDGPEAPDNDPEDLMGMAAGSYTVTVTDATGCTSWCTATINEPPVLACTISSTDATDCGTDDGSVTVTSTGGVAPYTYSLNGATAVSSNTFTALAAGSYTITTIDANGCTIDCITIVMSPQLPMCSIDAFSDASCFGANDGSLTATATGGTGNYEYSLDGGAFQTSGTFINLSSGSYTVTVRNAGQTTCSSTCNIMLSEPIELTCSVTGSPVLCGGGSDGTATVVAGGGTGSYTYAWSTTPTQTMATATMLPAGNFAVTVTDASGCMTICNYTITEPAPLTCSLAATDVSCNAGTDGIIDVTTTGGTGVIEYSLNGGTYQTAPSFTNLAAGSYIVSIRDANLCMSTCSVSLAEPDVLSCSNTVTDASDCAIDDGTISTSVIGGVSPYTYTLNGGTPQATNIFAGLGSGTYTILVTDANNCTTECAATVNSPLAPMCSIINAVDVSCNGGSNGSFEAVGTGGSGMFEYSLDAMMFVASGVYSNVSAGSYTVTVRNLGNPSCTSTCNVTISEPAVLSCSTTPVDVTCFGGADGSATVAPVGGTAPYTYLWDDALAQTTVEATGLSTGSYTVIITDANGCVSQCIAEINQPLEMTCSLIAVDVTCNGGVDGSITISETGGVMPFDYSLDGGTYQTSNSFADLSAGNYIVTVRDANSCITNCSIMINEPAALSCSVVATDASNCGIDDGSIVVTGVDGTPGYQYAIDGGTPQASPTFSNLGSGTYTMTIMDANGCASTCSGVVNAPSTPMCIIDQVNDITCALEMNGSIVVSGSGGSGTYEFSIDGVNYQTSGTFTNLGFGSYDVYVINAGQPNCVSICNVFLVEPELLLCSVANVSDATCTNSSDGSLMVLEMGGTPPYTFLWDDPAASTTALVTNLAPGGYNVTITDANGCQSICNGNVNTIPLVLCSISAMDVSCNGGMDGILSVTGISGTNPYEYSLEGGVFQTGNVYNNLSAGTYNVTIRDANNCMSSCSGTIAEPPLLECIAIPTDASDCAVDDGSISANGINGTPGYEYSLNGGGYQTAGTFTGLGAGTYTVTVRDANNCTSECIATVNTPSAPMCTVTTSTDVSCNGSADGSFSVAGSGGSGVYEYSLDGINFTSTTTYASLAADSYTVTIRNVGDPMCISTCNVIISEPAILVCSTTSTDVVCSGDADGTASASAVGGTLPYTYAWSDGQTAAVATNLIAATYTVTITDANGCVDMCDVTIIEPELMACDLVVVNEDCITGMAGSLTVNTSGGLIPYEYSLDGVAWQPGNAFNNLTAGTYIVTVRDQNLCTTTCSATVASIPCTELLAIGSTVFSDDNNNGIQDPGEDSLGSGSKAGKSVTLELYDANTDALVAITTTDVNGSYLFDNLLPGDYYIVFSPPASLPVSSTTTSTADDQIDGDDNGIQIDSNGDGLTDGVITSPVITLAAGTEPVGETGTNGGKDATNDDNGDMTVDFGLVPLMSIGSTVFADANDNGIQDAGEESLGSGSTAGKVVTLELYDAVSGALVATTTTDANGSYLFDNLLPGDYYIEFLPPTSLPVSSATTNTGDDQIDGDDNGIQLDTNGDGVTDGVITSPVISLVPGTEPVGEPGKNGTKDAADDANGDMTIDFGLVPLSQTYDLAMTKQVVTAGPYTAGQDVTYAIMVCNQGDVDANFFEITDHIPAGMMLSTTAGTNAGWVGGPTGDVTYAYNNLLAATDPDACATVMITLTIDPVFMGTSLTNEAEITNDDGDDIDSTPGVDDGPDTDNSMTDGADDEDPETITLGQTYDLAMTKQVVTAGPYTAGQDVTYAIMVCNQGTLDANFFEITDHIPAGMSLSTTAGTNAGWVGGPTGDVTYAYNNLLAATDPDACATINITLAVDPAFMGTSLTNEAELTNDDGDDVDSTPGVDDGPDTDNSMTDGADDEDPETITIGQTYDLAMTKQVVTAGPYTAGQDVTYAISVCNQGTMDANFFEITDHIPAGMSLSTTAGTNAGWVGGPTGDVTYAYNNLLAATDPDACATINITLTVDPAFMGTSLTNEAELTNDDGDDVDSTPGVDDGPDTDNSMTDGADDEDPETITIGQTYDLAMTKQVVTAGPYTAGQDVTYAISVCNQGTMDANFFEITDHIPAGMSLSTTAGTNAGWVGGPTGDVTYAYNNLLAATDPDACATINITLTVDPAFMGTSLTNEAELTNDDGDDIDSTPGVDDGPDTDNSMTDGADDEDPETITIGQTYDLAMTKQVVTAGPYTAGQDVTYAISVCNQGTMDANFFEITDHIPAGMSLSTTAGTNAGWVGGPTGDVTYAYNNLLAATDPDACATINITLTVDPAFMGTSLTNEAELTNDDGDDIDSTPGVDDGPDTDNSMTDGADDEDPETITIGQTYDLAMTKQVVTAGPYTAGQDVTYAISVCNQGTMDANFFELTDHIPVGMSLSTTAGLNTGWVGGPTGSVTYAYNNLLAATDPDACATVNITLTVDPTFTGASLINNAEISQDDGDDIDSDPTIYSNPDDLADDNLLTETDGGDDEDPEMISFNQNFDLALIKDLDPAQSTSVAPGDQVAYVITIINQGSVGAENIEITDYIPTGLTFNPLTNPTWTDNLDGTLTTTLTEANGGLPAGGLASMAMISTTLYLDVASNATQGLMLTNWAEISGATDDTGAPVTDSDSTPNSDQTDDVFAGDNETNNGGGDEDDHDPASVTIETFDLALIKSLATGQSSIVSAGDLITYTITVTNQGDIAADNIEIVDYLPACMTLADGNWTGVNPVFHTLSVANLDLPAGGLLPANTMSIDITVMLDATANAACDLTNMSEIASSTNSNGDPIPDNDSTSDINPLNDDYGGTDIIDNTGGDEDDHDDAVVSFMANCDLALMKEVASFISNGDGTGGQVTYTLTVTNQGGCEAYNVQVVDYIPAGMQLNDATWTLNGANGYAYTTIAGPIAALGTASVDITLDVVSYNPLNPQENFAEIVSSENLDGTTQGDMDSTPDEDPINDGLVTDNEINNVGGDEDDHDVETVEIMDLALTKTIISPTPYSVGQTIEYEICVVNEGNMIAQSIVVTDNLPAGMSFVSANNTGWTGAAPAIDYTFAGPLNPLQTTCTSLFLVLDPNPASAMAYTNVAEISSVEDENGGNPADWDSVPGNDNGDQSEDDEASASIDIYDLALTKSYSSFIDNSGNTILSQGDDVIYTITVYNQGTVDANNIQITDYLPAGMTLSTADANNWAGTGATVTNTIPFIAAMTTATVDIQVSIDANFMGTSLINTAEISSDDGDDADSIADNDPTNDVYVADNDINGTGGDEDDSDPAEITLQQFFDLALTKEFISSVDHDMSGTISHNDDVLYTITVYNQGTVDGFNIEITDYIPTGMTLSVNDTNNWVGGTTGSVTNTITSVLAGGAPASLEILLTVDPSFMGTYLTNWAEISNDNNGGDVDSTPDGIQFNGTGETDDLAEDNIIDNMNGDEDDHDPAPIMVGQVFDLALMKMVAAGQTGPFNVYDDITYSITVYNQGTLDAYNVGVIDYVQPGHIISPNDTNGWATDATGNYTTVIPGPIAPGGSATVDITMRVTQEAYILQLAMLTNIAEITGAEDVAGNPQTDLDSVADTTVGNDLQMDNVTNGSGGDEDDEDPAFAMLEPLDPLGYIYCEKTGQVVAGGLVTITGPGNIIYGIDTNGDPLDGRTGLYQFFVDVAGVYNLVYTHPSGIPLSTTCLPMPGTFDPTNLDGTAIDRDGIINNQLVLGFDTINGGLIDYTCLGNPYFMSVDIQPADPPIINMNNIPVSCAVIASTVCEDADLNGIADATDPGFDGITVSLFRCTDLTTPIATQVTSNGGQYDFGALNAGCYRLYFDLPVGFAIIGGGTVMNADGWTNDINVAWGECYADATFCLTQANAGLGDRVWHDRNGNGVQDLGELGIPGVKVILYNENGNILDYAFTNSNGFYLFEDLRPGHYYVKFVDPEGYTLTTANSGNNDGEDSDVDHSNGPGTTASTWIDPAEFDLSLDAGYYNCVPVGDFVWLDVNGNGLQDSNENGINGLRVNLYKLINGVGYLVDYTYTGHKPGTGSDDGYWKFCAAPGDYYIHFEATSSMIAVNPGNGISETDSNITGTFGQNTTASFAVVSGEHRCDIDGGFSLPGANIAPLTIGDGKGISLSDITGINVGEFNKLEWTAFDESVVEYYSILKKQIDGTFVTIGRLMTIGNENNPSDYVYEDYSYTIGLNEYKMIAFDSNDKAIMELRSDVDVVDLSTSEIKLYPSITTTYANLKVTVSKDAELLVHIVSVDGSTYVDSIVETNLRPGANLFRINTAGLAPGIYYLRVLLNNELTTKKLIVVGK